MKFLKVIRVYGLIVILISFISSSFVFADWDCIGGNCTTTDNVGIGTSDPQAILDVQGGHVKLGGLVSLKSDSYTQLKLLSHSDTAWQGSFFQFYRSRGTEAAKSVVLKNDLIGCFDIYGYDGDSFERTAQMQVYVDGNVSDEIVPSGWRFSTTDAAGTLYERMRISSTGTIVLGNTGKYNFLEDSAFFGAEIPFQIYSNADTYPYQKIISIRNSNNSSTPGFDEMQIV